ncbi:MAG: hypothetical protein JSU94_19025 [Phycisphaerales bacterium]|nr:MAG: hypothetical protein JSU94_19025 [Phycisphaerales bacterium]
MSKIAIAILMAAAFAYAIYLVLLRHELPDPGQARRARRRFILATLLFVGLLRTGPARAEERNIMCYLRVELSPADQIQIAGFSRVAATLKAAWRTLDPNQSEQFRKLLEISAESGTIRRKTANMLATAYFELAFHKQQTRPKASTQSGEAGPFVLCYKMSPDGWTLRKSRENALQQIELLVKSRQAGAIDNETAAKAHAALARDVQILGSARQPGIPRDRRQLHRLAVQYEAGNLEAGDAALVAAAMIVEMEEGSLPDFTPAKRLATMKKRVHDLLVKGPRGNDWMDPAINPNVFAVLHKAELIDNRPMVTCYDRAAVPVKARSEELKGLQQQLLDKNVKTGVLDVEIADKAAAATANETYDDFAVEREIREYQKRLRRAIRLLYKHGELSSGFVRRIEDAVDIDIISFNRSRALRNDVGYCIRSLFWRQPLTDGVTKTLEEAGLIGRARNHRRVLELPGRKWEPTEDDRKKLAEFRKLIESSEPFNLDADANASLFYTRLDAEDIEYRLSIRRVCRALIKTGLANSGQLRELQELIAIPLVGTLKAT